MNPNDPHNNRSHAKEDPYDGRQRRAGGSRGNGHGPAVNENGEVDAIVGDIRDQGLVFVLFLMGVASFLLREINYC